MQKYFPVSDFNNEEEARFIYKKYFNRLASLVCGYAAAADFVFQLFDGREEEFYERFHFPMYKVVDGKIDFNYELFMLKFYHYSKIDKQGEKEAIINSFSKDLYEFQLEEYLKERNNNKSKKKDITKMTDEEWEEMKKDEEEKNRVIREYKEKIANAESEQPLTVIPKDGNFGYIHQFLRQFGITINVYSIDNFDDPHVGDIVASNIFKLHLLDENGNIIAVNENNYSHYFYITDITSDGKIIVSNNGLMYQFDPNEANSTEIVRLELSK